MALTVGEAKEIMRRLGPAEVNFAISICTPLYWVVRGHDGKPSTRNGTAFFLQTPKALFGVTAAHIIKGPKSWHAHCEEHGPTQLRLAGCNGTSIPLDWDARAVDINLDLDIATFTISQAEIASLGKIIYSGYPSEWPPSGPDKNKGVFYAGFPGISTRHQSAQEAEFGAFGGSGIASGVNEKDILSQIEREHIKPAREDGIPPENFNFGGISGGPMLYVVETKSGLRCNSLAGVIYAGPNTSDDPNEAIPGFELLHARRARFIRADGVLDHGLWESVQI